MACCPHGYAPTALKSVRRYYKSNGRTQSTFRLQSESSHCSGSEDGDVRMVVEVRVRIRVSLTVPSPAQGIPYLFKPPETLTARSLLEIHGDPAVLFSSPDAALETLALLFSPPLPPGSRRRLLLREVIGRFARATLARAGIAGERGPIRVLADVEQLLRLRSHQEVDDMLNRRHRGVTPPINAESSTLGTCAVCLQEIKKEWLRNIHLPCSHVFHLDCICPWLQRNNSCPMCRGTVPLAQDGAA